MGWLLLIEAFFMLFPMLASILCDESDWKVFLFTSGVTAITGGILSLRSRPLTTVTGKRDGFLLTAMVWVIFSIFGMLPFLICSSPMTLSDAFFEAMSGFTTTGASVITSVEAMSHGIHLWRAMMQWIGGMGIILFTLAVIPMLNHAGGIQMFNAEVTGITHDKISPRISQTAKTLWLIYLSLTAAVILLLWAGPMTLFESICHGFGTISTGGYTIYDEGLSFWHDSVYTKVVITLFMFIGGTNFALLFRAAKGNFTALRTNDVFKTYLGVILGMLLLFIPSIWYFGKIKNWQSVTLDPLFQIISTITSTGYTVADFESWGPFVLSLTFVMMFFGACAGSTSGGAKIDRILYLFKNVHNELYRTLYPNSILSVKINDKVINPELVTKVIAFLCLYMLLIVAGGAAVTATGVPIVDAFFSSFSCLSNTGLGAGITGVGGSYDILPDTAKWILAILMLIGRLEIFTVLVILTPAFWRR
jgi:putative K(+) transport-related membrane protein